MLRQYLYNTVYQLIILLSIKILTYRLICMKIVTIFGKRLLAFQYEGEEENDEQ